VLKDSWSRAGRGASGAPRAMTAAANARRRSDTLGRPTSGVSPASVRRGGIVAQTLLRAPFYGPADWCRNDL
jgi:hypothetical protein